MRRASPAFLFAGVLLVAPAALAQSTTTTVTSSHPNCRVIERGSAEAQQLAQSGPLSSSVTAGGGQVTAQTSGGPSVTVQSGSGSVSSSVTTGSSGSTVITANGECLILVNPGEKERPQ